MLELLSGLTFIQLLILIIVILGIIGAFIIFILKRFPVTINKGGNSIAINNKIREEKLKEKISMQKRDLLVIMGKVTEVTNKQTQIRKVETLNNQMSFAEDKMGDLRTLFDSKFIEILKERLGPENWGDIQLNQDLRKYGLVVRGALSKIMNSFRAACRENHFDEYDEEKFLYYAERRSSSYLKVITDAVINEYIKPLTISQEEIIKVNTSDVYPKVKEVFTSFFSNARKVSAESAKKIEELDVSLFDFIINYLGIDVSREEKEIFMRGLEIENEAEIRKRMLSRY